MRQSVMKCFFVWAMFFSVLVSVPAEQRFTVTATAGDDAIAFNMAAFKAGADTASKTFASVLKADLVRSGYFSMVSGGGQVGLSGACQSKGGQFQADCLVYKVASRERIMGTRYGPVAEAEVRRLAHKVADDMVYAVTGKKGMASGRIALVGTRSGSKELYVCDMDGGGMHQYTQDRSIVVGPTWSADGKRLVYSSYKLGYPNLFLLGQSKPISYYGGLNAGGAISPDGRSMALILSKDGNPELYVRDLGSGQLTRLTKTRTGNEASPCWSPDGKTDCLCF